MRLFASTVWNSLARSSDRRIAIYVATLTVILTVTTWGLAAVGSMLISVVDAHLPSQGSEGLSRVEMHVLAASVTNREDIASRTIDTNFSIAQPTRHVIAPTLIVGSRIGSIDDDRFGEGGGYKTVCVRLCDGYFFPISSRTSQSNFRNDLAKCEQMCGGTPVRLFAHPAATESTGDMQDLTGLPYAHLKTAFRFRTTFDAGCKCTAAPWEQQSTDRHRLYALEAARAKGDATVVPELAALRTKVAEDARLAKVKTRVANVQAVAAGIAAPGPGSRMFRDRSDDDGETDYRFSRLPAGTPAFGDASRDSQPTARRSSGSLGSGGGSSWQVKVFSGN